MSLLGSQRSVKTKSLRKREIGAVDKNEKNSERNPVGDSVCGVL